MTAEVAEAAEVELFDFWAWVKAEYEKMYPNWRKEFATGLAKFPFRRRDDHQDPEPPFVPMAPVYPSRRPGHEDEDAGGT